MHLSLPTTRVSLRRHLLAEVQHCAAIVLYIAPGQEVVLSWTPGMRHPRLSTFGFPPLITSTPPAGMADAGGEPGGGSGGGDGGAKGFGALGAGGGGFNVYLLG